MGKLKLETKTWLNKIILPVVFASLFLFFLYVAKDMSPNRNDAKLEELQLLSTQIPVVPKSKKVGTFYSSRFLDAGLYNYYSSTAKYDEVERFYLSTLTQEGWVRANEQSPPLYKEGEARKLTFKKGEYRLIIEYAGDGTNRSWNYALNLLWR